MFNKSNQNIINKTSKELEDEIEKFTLRKSLRENINLFRTRIFNDEDSIVFRIFQNKKSNIEFCIIFFDGMVESLIVNEGIIHPIMYGYLDNRVDNNDLPNYLMNKIIDSKDVRLTSDMSKLIEAVTYGDTILLAEGSDKALIIDTKGWNTRALEEPQGERVVRGPREGFTESIMVNLSLVRRRIRDSRLKTKFKQVGARTKTTVCIAYIEGLANHKIIDELQRRIDGIDIDGIFSSNAVSELIRDEPFSIFRTIGTTERPDVVGRKLLEGRIAVFCDGTPMVLTLPYIFLEYFQVNEDYYDDYYFGTFNRLIRIIGFIISISLPAVYVSVVSFHQELVPTRLLLSIKQAREGVPFPTLVETILMLLTFEVIREAGVRLPSHIGESVSIVGALVLGQAAVDARIVSAPVLIIAATTGITSLLIPEILGGTIFLRLTFLFLASILGIHGYMFGVIILVVRLVSMKSFGVPYMLKIGAIKPDDIKDTIVRMPWWTQKSRSRFISRDTIRQKDEKSRRKR